jgi:guanylate kinase
VLLEIEVQGALQVRSGLPEALLIFLVPPAFDELERRLRDRGTEDEATILNRLEVARGEMNAIRTPSTMSSSTTTWTAAPPRSPP